MIVAKKEEKKEDEERNEWKGSVHITLTFFY